MEPPRSSPLLVTDESIARELWLLGLRGRKHTKACVEEHRKSERQGVLIERVRFWDVLATEHAERHPHDPDAELRYRYSRYQDTFRAETHERLDPSRVSMYALVHRRQYVFGTGRWARFVRDVFPTVERRVRKKLVARAVPEGRLDELTQDVTGEVWVRACTSIGSFDPRVGTLDGWFEGVLSKTVSLALRRERKRNRLLDPFGDVLYVIDRCEDGLAERAVRNASNEEFGREIFPLLRSRTRRLVQKVLDEEPLRGSDSQTWERNLARMQKQCESRGWTP